MGIEVYGKGEMAAKEKEEELDSCSSLSSIGKNRWIM